MACFNFEHLYQIAVDTRLIFILVESLKYCQKLYENIYFVPFAGNTLNQDGQNSIDHFTMVGAW